ncbi:MAG: hypothetical protein LUE92_12190 [Clostridiales bacterium]|nr:hypothetical protein [Clostridiales bacterium]
MDAIDIEAGDVSIEVDTSALIEDLKSGPVTFAFELLVAIVAIPVTITGYAAYAEGLFAYEVAQVFFFSNTNILIVIGIYEDNKIQLILSQLS